MKKFGSLILTMFLGIFLISCGGASPKSVVNNYFNDLKKEDNIDLSKYLNSKVENPSLDENKNNKNESEEESEIVKEANKIMCSKLEVKTGEETIDGNTATVEVTVKGLNLANILSEYIKSVFADALKVGLNGNKVNEDEMLKESEGKYLQMVKDAQVEERTGKITLTKDDDSWKIDANKELTQLLFGQVTTNN